MSDHDQRSNHDQRSGCDQRSNNYPGRCVRCDVLVPAKGGVIFRDVAGGRWKTFCRDHAPLPLGAVEAAEAERERKRQRRVLELDGRLYTPVEFKEVCRSFPGSRWDPDEKCWRVCLDLEVLSTVVQLCERHGITYPPSFRERLSQASEEAADDGPDLDTRLYPYQREGALFLRQRSRALVGDAMGLGKTAQALQALPHSPRVLIVCPATLKLNWRREIIGGPGRIGWRPDLRVKIVSGKQQGVLIPDRGEAIVINYDVLPPESAYATLSKDQLAALSETIVIFDECQKMKNYKAIRHKRGKALANLCGKVWLLTGTPLMNRPPDLKGILEVGGLFNKVFGNWSQFVECFHGRKNRWGGMKWGAPTPDVSDRMRRIMLRRLVEDVLPDLPEKRYQQIEVELSDEDDKERDRELRALSFSLDEAYHKHKNKMDEGQLPPFEEFSAIRAELAKAKIPALLEEVKQREESEEPIIVFSAHRAPVDLLGARPGWGVICGDTPKEKRQQVVERFQAGQLKGVALTIQAGGEGLTLTRARTAIFLDLDWTPALNSQAEARIRRIGSEKGHVTYVHLVADHVLERHVHALLTEKTEIHTSAIDGPGLSTPITVRKEIPEVKAETDEEFLARLERVAQEDEERKAKRKISEIGPDEARKEAAKRKATAIRDRERARAGIKAAPEINEEMADAIRDAIRYMASVCDGAIAKDGVGFNKIDTGFGHVLATAGLEDPDSLEAAYHILRRYPKQLSGSWGILWDDKIEKESFSSTH